VCGSVHKGMPHKYFHGKTGACGAPPSRPPPAARGAAVPLPRPAGRLPPPPTPCAPAQPAPPRAGIVYNVTKRAVGVELNKPVRNRIVKKRVNIRVEHVFPSKCRTDFLKRVKHNETVKREAKKAGTRAPIEQLKRYPGTPKDGYLVSAKNAEGVLPTLVAPTAFDEMI
jgi:ribosomal protein L21E